MFLKRVYRLLQLINLLSLDIVLNSWVLCTIIGLVTGMEVNVTALYLLCMSIWCIYTIDHLLDAYKNKQKYLSIRHLFHRKYFISLWTLVVLVIIFGIYLAIVFLPISIWYIGLTFVGIVFIYLLYCFFAKTYLIPKEIIICIVYTCGLWIPYTEHLQSFFNIYYLFLFLMLFFTVFNNLVLFSAIDIQEDKKSDFDSLLIKYSFINPKHTHGAIILLVIILFVANLINFNRMKWEVEHPLFATHPVFSLQAGILYIGASVICLIINLLYIQILIYASHPFVKRHFRLIADNLFLLFLLLYCI